MKNTSGNNSPGEAKASSSASVDSGVEKEKWSVVEFDDCGQMKWDIENSKGVSVCSGCFRNRLMADEIAEAHNAATASLLRENQENLDRASAEWRGILERVNADYIQQLQTAGRENQELREKNKRLSAEALQARVLQAEETDVAFREGWLRACIFYVDMDACDPEHECSKACEIRVADRVRGRSEAIDSALSGEKNKANEHK